MYRFFSSARLAGVVIVMFSLSIVAAVLLGSTQAKVPTKVADNDPNLARIALLKWYEVSTVTSFPTEHAPFGVAFDGANIWVSNQGGGGGINNVMKIRAADGATLGSFPTGGVNPVEMAFDGANIWI